MREATTPVPYLHRQGRVWWRQPQACSLPTPTRESMMEDTTPVPYLHRPGRVWGRQPRLFLICTGKGEYEGGNHTPVPYLHRPGRVWWRPTHACSLPTPNSESMMEANIRLFLTYTDQGEYDGGHHQENAATSEIFKHFNSKLLLRYDELDLIRTR